MMNLPIILASRSPRRIALLQQLGLECSVMPADIDESVRAGELPSDYVSRLAVEKAQAVHVLRTTEYADHVILAADTTVALHDEVLGKPEHDADALAMLQKLSGTTHYVHTAVAVCRYNQTLTALSSTQVEMMPLDAHMLADYIKTGEHRDKAGSYAIQGLAGAWIKRIVGSYTGVMGLPLYETAMLFKQMEK